MVPRETARTLTDPAQRVSCAPSSVSTDQDAAPSGHGTHTLQATPPCTCRNNDMASRRSLLEPNHTSTTEAGGGPMPPELPLCVIRYTDIMGQFTAAAMDPVRQARQPRPGLPGHHLGGVRQDPRVRLHTTRRRRARCQAPPPMGSEPPASQAWTTRRAGKMPRAPLDPQSCVSAGGSSGSVPRETSRELGGDGCRRSGPGRAQNLTGQSASQPWDSSGPLWPG